MKLTVHCGRWVSPLHATLLVLHVGSGALALLLAPFGLAARKARGRHTRIGWVYAGLVSVLAASALGLSALHWSRLWWLAAIAVATELAVVGGLVARRRDSDVWHVSLMCGSYLSLVTALLVVNLGGPVAWILPTVVGSPVIAWAARRAALRAAPRAS
jgi:hypothetical protein